MSDGEPGVGAAGGLAVEVEADSCINYALQQNHVPTIRRIRVHNKTDRLVENLTVRIVMDPDVAPPLVLRIDSVVAGGTHAFGVVDLSLSASRLVQQSERQAGSLRTEVQDGSGLVAQATNAIDVLAYNEWPGTRLLPELLAAFVLPNHPAVEQVLRAASDILLRETKDGALAGYQSRSAERVVAVARAVYAACAALDLAYIAPPASFESCGQKVRTPDQILASRLGTCLDLTLLFAAALEQAGLNPLLLLPKGHALVGVWLEEDSFQDPSTDDVTRIRKRVDLGQILVFETTVVTARPVPRFEDAVRAGAKHLQDGAQFHVAIDVRAARQARIRPVALRVEGAAAEQPSPSVGVEQGLISSSAAVVVGAGDAPRGDPPPRETGPARIEAWKRKLLDLSLRNRLINFRETKASIPILCPSLARLEDKLADGQTFDLSPEPETLGKNDPRSQALLAPADMKGSREAFLADELDARRLYAPLEAEELDDRLTQIFRSSRESLEEGGANTLFLALGFLRWFETKTSTQPRLAPILLLPLQLERRTVVEGFKLKLADQDPQFNVTMLQKMSADFGLDITGLDSLDEDESGLDVRKILMRMRKAVLKMDRWEVVESAVIGLFSFTKYLMWLDLDTRTNRLLQNAVVKHLVETPDRPFAPDTRFPELERLDEERDPAATFCPLDADSSQLRAIYAAADGATFVLEGPPGTGKSQTITNLIANAVASGQRVLFVSEKMAALNVVKKRLTQVGLGPFCLELHSNKAQKRAIMDQLKAALQSGAPAPTTDWVASGTKLKAVRGELNAYSAALHARRSVGLSVQEAMGRLIDLREAASVPMAFASAESVDADDLATMRGCAHELALAAVEAGDLTTSPWREAGLTLWEPALPEAIRDAAVALQAAAREAERCAAALGEALGLPGVGASERALRALAEHGRFLAATPGPTVELLLAPDRALARKEVEGWIGRIEEQRARLEGMRESFRDETLALDLLGLRGELAAASASAWPLGWWRARAPRRVLATAWKGHGALPGRRPLVAYLDQLLECKAGQEGLAALDPAARALLGPAWRGIDTDLQMLRGWLDWSDTFRKLLARAAGLDLDLARRLWDRWTELATREQAMLASDGPVGQALARAEAALATLDAAVLKAAGVLGSEARTLAGAEDAPGFTARLDRLAAGWLGGLPLLRGWCAWRRARARALEAGLATLVEAVEAGRVGGGDAEEVFERSFLEWWVGAMFRAHRVLADFARVSHEDKIRRFQNLDIHVVETAHEVVAARIAERIPRGSVELSSMSSSEMGILRREIERQRGHMPLRKLLQRIPAVVTRLKPCFLMSPLSVAQYLDSDFPPFDLVVFDEASQIPVYDAIGAIARGNRLIVVGDSRQLPPTSFFSRTEDEEVADEADVADLESILDECRAAQLPPLDLKWHYRSRHESLIAFSNHNYYDNGLLTFPSSQLASDDLGVGWRYLPNGVYDRGRSRANRAEAEAVVAHIVERLLDPERAQKSVGVVTFSVAQQCLVEDLLDEARRKHPEIEPHFSAEREEPVFVKNLENVQGDERDVILFSVCYGPDLDGNVAMNFGPLNRDGGERRLNVAITRAREALVVFTSMRADAIDLARSRAVGVRHLKDFLDFAERGVSALGSGLDVSPDAECESPFEEDVREELVRRGWSVQPQVGCSGYRVDLGVTDPARPGRFLLGIECDGAMYHSGKTARDRDRLRQAVLEGLGWKIHRIWSTDWWQARDAEIARLLRCLEDLRDGQTSVTAGAAPRSTAKSELFASAAHIQAVVTATIAPPVRAPGRPAGARDYLVADVPVPHGRRPTPERFYEQASGGDVRLQIDEVLRVEAPMEEALLAERIAPTWGLKKVTGRVVERLRAVGRFRETRSSDGTHTFLWRRDQDPLKYDEYRVPGGNPAAIRDAQAIPPEEIANAAEALLRDHVSMGAASLARELGRVFGFARLGAKVEAAMSEGIDVLCKQGRAADVAGQIRLREVAP